MSDRAVMQMIADLVPAGSRVLDLGCGTGELLAHLQATKGCTGYGWSSMTATCWPVPSAAST